MEGGGKLWKTLLFRRQRERNHMPAKPKSSDAPVPGLVSEGAAKMEPREYVERAIRRLEQCLGLQITIVDHEGWFQTRQKEAVFSERRKSHHKYPCCLHGFCWDCRKHCRYALNQLCIDEPSPHYTVCWKGIGQMAVPLRRGNFHYGVLFAGTFRQPGRTPPKGLPTDFYKAYAALPPVDPALIKSVMPTLAIFARGLLDYLCDENILNFDYDFRVRRLLEFLEERHGGPIALEDVARQLNLSTAYTSSFIKQSMGCTFSQLLRSIRIDHAKKLLTTTEEKLRSIALACGFSSEFHLSKVFKQQTGESPSDFRRHN